MIRTQVYLPKTLYQRIQLKAEHDHKPAAQVIRELLAQGITSREGSSGEGLLRIAQHAATRGPADLSRRIDDYLYGDR
jgi:hypothetical protein